MKKILVIGAGLGGLAAAIRLARAGHAVEVWEKNAGPGGKLKELSRDGFSWGTGPSLLTMPHVVRELFSAAGERMEDHLQLVRLDSACRYFWTDCTIIDEDETFFRRPEVARFLEYARGIYELSGEAYLNRPPAEFWRAFTLGNLGKLRHLGKVATTRTLAAEVERRLTDPHLRQIFLRFATYNGSSPYLTPATFNIIPYVEAEFGAWYVRGGMAKIATELAALAERQGVVFRFHTTATGWDGREAFSQDGFRAQADILICNADVLGAICGGSASGLTLEISQKRGQAPFSQRLGLDRRREMKKEPVPFSLRSTSSDEKGASPLFSDRRPEVDGYRGFLSDIFTDKDRAKLHRPPLSTSGYILFLGVRGRDPRLAHHNIFFSDNYPREFDEIHRQKISPTEPTIYIAVSARTDPSHAPPDHHNYFVLINAPARDPRQPWTEAEAKSYRNVVLRRLEHFGFADLSQRIVTEQIFTPSDFATRDLAHHGALYGWASHSIRASLFRPPLRAPNARNVYFVGGTTHPGGGIPLVLLSGKMVADMIQRECA